MLLGTGAAVGCGGRTGETGLRSGITPVDASAPTGAGSCDTPPGTQVCTANGWCWQNPLPERPNFRAIWGSAAADVWISAEPGALLHFDGVSWSSFDAHTSDQVLSIWGASASDVWAVGRGGSIVHYDGTRWAPFASPTTEELSGVAGSATDDVWAVGTSGGPSTVLHFDGVAWSAVDPGFPDVVPSAVWAAGPSDAWIVGMGPQGAAAILHWDGVSFTLATNPGARPLNAIWGSGANDIYAVGGTPTLTVLLHYDGLAWTTVGNAGRGLTSVWGSGPNDVWVAGALGRVDHFDGTQWSSPISLTRDTFYALWGSGASDVWAVGIGTALDGRAWRHWDGTTWATSVSAVTFDDQVAVAAVAADDIYFVGAHRTLVHYDGQSLSPSVYLPTIFFPSSAFAASADDVYVVGSAGVIVRGNARDGWQTLASGTTASLHGVHGSAANDVWVVGDGGTALHWNGLVWLSVATGTTAALTAVWASSPLDAWIVGDGGITLHWNGLLLTSGSTGSTGWVTTLAASAPNDVWGAGADLLHWNGSAWQSTRLGLPIDPYGNLGIIVATILPLASDDVWIFGTPVANATPQPASAYHFDGVAWSPSAIASSAATSGTVLVGSDLWSIGRAGTIVRRACGLGAGASLTRR